MKALVFFFMICSADSVVKAQNELFIYMQEASGRAFYVRLGEKSYSSNSGGYLLLSGLKDSVYHLYVGYPGNVATERLFTVAMKEKNRGFSVSAADGLGRLVDLQTQEAVAGEAAALSDTTVMGNRKTDSYSELMAGVVNDSAVLYAPLPVGGEVKTNAVVGSATPPASRDTGRAMIARSQATDSIAKPMVARPERGDTAALMGDVADNGRLRDSSKMVSKEVSAKAAGTQGSSPHGDTASFTIDTGRAVVSDVRDSVHNHAVALLKDTMRADSIGSHALAQARDTSAPDSIQRSRTAAIADTTIRDSAAGKMVKREVSDSFTPKPGPVRDSVSRAAKDSVGSGLLVRRDSVRTPVADSVANPFAHDARVRVANPGARKDSVPPADHRVAPVHAAVKGSVPPDAAQKGVLRLETQNRQEGFQMIYLDRTGTGVDTIRILIPRQ